MISGHSTVYHVITHGEDICAEMLVSGWMKPFMAPVVQALDLLEDLSGTPRGRGCERIPFAVYAAQGWPIMAGKIDHLTFETRNLEFDYQPRERELALPAHYENGRPDRVVLEAFAPKPYRSARGLRLRGRSRSNSFCCRNSAATAARREGQFEVVIASQNQTGSIRKY